MFLKTRSEVKTFPTTRIQISFSGFFSGSLLLENTQMCKSENKGPVQASCLGDRFNSVHNIQSLLCNRPFFKYFFTEFHTAIYQKSRIIQHQNNVFFLVQIANQKEGGESTASLGTWLARGTGDLELAFTLREKGADPKSILFSCAMRTTDQKNSKYFTLAITYIFVYHTIKQPSQNHNFLGLTHA